MFKTPTDKLMLRLASLIGIALLAYFITNFDQITLKEATSTSGALIVLFASLNMYQDNYNSAAFLMYLGTAIWAFSSIIF